MGEHERASARRIGATRKLLEGHPDDVVRVVERLDAEHLANLAEAIADEERSRAVRDGDLEAIIDNGFDAGFGRDGLGVNPWVQGSLIVCPGAIVTRGRRGHRCRFVSVGGTWIWDSAELIREEKRSTPGADDGFRAVAVLPLVTGLELDVVSGRARGGAHSVDSVTSLRVRGRRLVEVAQRSVAPSGMQ